MKSLSTPDLAAVMVVLRATESALGARQIRDALAKDGIRLSESTIARRLRELDRQKLTEIVGASGRKLTNLGREQADLLVRVDRSATELAWATKVRTATDVLHLLKARRAIEPEAVADAAATVTPADIRRLRQLIGDHVVQLCGRGPLPRTKALDFHRSVTGLATNPLVRAMLNTVLDKSLDRIEAALDVILQVHNSDKVSVDEHRLIVDAISRRDDEEARRIMHEHLGRLCEEVAVFVDRNDPDLLERLLQWRTVGHA